MNKKVKTILPIVSALIVVVAGYFIVDSILTVKPGEVEPRNKKIERVNKDNNSKKNDNSDAKKKKEKKEEPKIPDVVGLDLKTAKWLIKKNKCELGTVTYETSDAVYDTVMKQTPESGKKTKDKVVINIVLSNGAAFGINETRVTKPVKKVEEEKDDDKDNDKDENGNSTNQNSQGQGQGQSQGQYPSQGQGQTPTQGQNQYPGQGQQTPNQQYNQQYNQQNNQQYNQWQ